MSKSDVLTEKEFSGFSFSRRILQQIETYRNRNGLKKNDVTILDWGCGRGRAVLWLRDAGYDAFGVEIDAGPVENGETLFREHGHDPSSLRLLSEDGRSPFPDGFFDITFSSQVLEHVADLDAVAIELARVTRPGGLGFHVYPARLHPVEAHLKMPFIHWLPKNILRHALVSTFVRLGIEPRWKSLNEIGNREKAEAYYRYSVEKTHYRPLHATEAAFRKAGLRARFDTVNDPMIRQRLAPITGVAFLKTSINALLLTFVKVELLLEKP